MAERTSDRWVSVALSVLLHGSLVAALVYGFWTFQRSRPPAPTLAIEATVVDARSVNGAALNIPPQPQPQPKAEPPPPQPAPTPPPEPPPVEPTGPPEPTPEELAQRQQAEKEAAQKEQQQRQKQAEQEAAETQRKLEQQQQAQAEQRQRQQKERVAQKQAEAEKAAEAKRRADEQRVAEQKRQEALQRAADEKLKAERESELQNSLKAEEHSNALRASGALASWQSQISARIHRAWLQPPTARSGIECELFLTQKPGGVVTSARVGACNGDQAMRESIEAAAYRASPLPPPPDPSLFVSDLEITFRPD